jgi:hypothetical protein
MSTSGSRIKSVRLVISSAILIVLLVMTAVSRQSQNAAAGAKPAGADASHAKDTSFDSRN